MQFTLNDQVLRNAFCSAQTFVPLGKKVLSDTYTSPYLVELQGLHIPLIFLEACSGLRLGFVLHHIILIS